jgi:DNA mismatch repair protein MutS
LLDSCCNEFSRDVLIQLLSEVPDTLGEVLIRQEIIKTLMSNEQLHRPFSYSRSEFHEVYTYMQ